MLKVILAKKKGLNFLTNFLPEENHLSKTQNEFIFVTLNFNVLNMKVLLDVNDSRSDFFMEMIKSLKYVTVLDEIKEKRKSEIIGNLAEAFHDVALFEKGEKKLKKAKDLLNEL